MIADLVAKSIPFILPAFLLICFIYTHRPPKFRGPGKSNTNTSSGENTPEKQESHSISENDMSSP